MKTLSRLRSLKTTMGGEKKEQLLIIIPIAEPKELTDRLRKNFPNFDIKFIQTNNFWHGAKGEFGGEVFKDAKILMTGTALPANPAADAPNLELVHFFSAGSNHAQEHPIYTSTRIPLTTSSGVHGPQIAEWVVLTRLVQSHAYNLLRAQEQRHEWKQVDILSVSDLAGQRVGVLGYGSIGRQVARVARALGMHVVAYTASPRDTPAQRRDAGYVVPRTGDPEGEIPEAWYAGLDKPSLHEFLKQGFDMLVVSLPLTDKTHHLLGAEEFELVKEARPFLSNISRGSIIDQEALVTALKEDKLRGAALDVTDPEPLPEGHPLWDMENVTVTPHISGMSVKYAERTFAILEENLRRMEKGEKLINEVDRERGY